MKSKAHQIQIKLNIKRTTCRPIIVKLLKTQDNKQTFTVARNMHT